MFDGKGNAARMRFNAMGRVESVTGRAPFNHRIDYKYDANYNEIESAQSFERLDDDASSDAPIITSTILRELKQYNALDNLTSRTLVGDGNGVTESFTRDADERIIRQLQPLGNVTEYVFDERNLLLEKISGAGTQEQSSQRFTYTPNGALSGQTDGAGNMTTHHYDGFHRYKGFTSPIGSRKTQWFDEADNVVRVAIDGADGGNQSATGRLVRLMDATYHFDQWNRAYRVDRSWHDQATGELLGNSKWNGQKGVVSTILEYADNGLPARVWTEAGNVVAVEYDGAGRIVRASDSTGEDCALEYDQNDNPTLMRYQGPLVNGRRAERVLRRQIRRHGSAGVAARR